VGDWAAMWKKEASIHWQVTQVSDALWKKIKSMKK
jgi:hypothetical protein